MDPGRGAHRDLIVAIHKGTLHPWPAGDWVEGLPAASFCKSGTGSSSAMLKGKPCKAAHHAAHVDEQLTGLLPIVQSERQTM